MSDGISEYWKAKKIEDITREAANATARVIGRPDLDKSPILTMHGKDYRVRVEKIEMVCHNGNFDFDGGIDLTEIPVLGKFEVKE